MSPLPFDPGPLADVACSTESERPTLVFSRYLRHPPASVWAALTDPAQLRQWSPFEPDRSLAATGPARLTMKDGSTVEEYSATVRRAEAPNLLEYTWGDDLLRWELAAEGAGTRLVLRHTVAGAEWVPRTAAGWHLCLVVAERFLEGQPIGPIAGREAKKFGWEALHDAYGARLGIEGKGWPEEVLPGS